MEQKSAQKSRFGRYIEDQNGAVTVDWVVLTAAIVGLGMAAAFTVGSNVPGVADQISDTMADME